MGALDHAASCGDPSRTHDAYLRRGLADSVTENEADSFFHAQLAARETAFFQSLCNELVGILILLPNPHVRIFAVGRVGDLFSGAAFFERRTNIKWYAFGRQDQGKHPLSAPPANAGEVFQRCAFHEQDGVEFVLGHQLAGALLALLSLFAGDWLGFILSGFQASQCWRQGCVGFRLRFARSPER